MTEKQHQAVDDASARAREGAALSPKARWLFLAIAIAIILNYLPLLQSHARQDDCSFGPVSNARYRELLAEAKASQSTKWLPLTWSNSEASALLESRVDDLSGKSGSVYERLAAMHAIMRAAGADYRSTGGSHQKDSDTYRGALNGAGIVPFHYHLDVNRLGYFRPIRRNAWIVGSLAIKDAKGMFQRPLPPGKIEFVVWFPEFLDTYIQISRESGEQCPRMPPAALAEQINLGK